MYKQVIIVRKDLKWDKGKMITHSIHAAVSSMKNVDKSVVEHWERKGAKKVVLKAVEKELKDVYRKVKAEKLPHCLVRDAGLTQLKAGTITALGIGPVNEKEIDRITGKLKLL